MTTITTSRTPIIAGNWKMNTTLPEAEELARAIRAQAENVRGVEVVLCPPFISLAAVAEAVRGSSIKVGAQNLYHEPKGAFTGEVAAIMLQGLCDYVVLGHSERRGYFKETSAFVNAKVRAALQHGLRPIVCVGETLAQREAGRTAEVLRRQTRESLAGVEDLSRVVVAYEPVWAIGTGRAATPQDAADGIAVIRRAIGRMGGAQAADRVRILYGGSMNAENAASLLEQPGVDGGLIGGASLRADQFTAIVRAAERRVAAAR
jgi:triosephosphate isomerase